jgi:hypothetical protein
MFRIHFAEQNRGRVIVFIVQSGFASLIVQVKRGFVLQVNQFRLAVFLFASSQKGIGHNPQKPRFEIRSRFKGVKAAKRFDRGFLHQIFGIFRLAR